MPALQAVHALADVAASTLDHVPTPQLMHTAEAVALETEDHVPAPHATQALPEYQRPTPQSEEQAADDVLPVVAVNSPAEHATQVDDAVAPTVDDQKLNVHC